ncbi:replication factor A protein 2 [Terramyces sp. JEL0728]|nr:replication factor A protein 2 [Terramyces sp. JEL0728]
MMGYGGYPTGNNTAANTNTGGGFTSPSPFGSPYQSPGKKSSNQTFRHVTIKQLASATQVNSDSPFVVDKADIFQVAIIARITKVTINSSNTLYVVDDGTGSIEARQYTDNAENEMGNEFTEGTYVKVVGHLKAFQGKKSLNVNRIIPIDSVDELTHHFLQIKKDTVKEPQNSVYSKNSSSYGNSDLNPVQAQIATVLQQNPNSTGTHIDDILHRLRGMDSEANIRDQIEAMTNEGLLYTTIDEDHYGMVSSK